MRTGPTRITLIRHGPPLLRAPRWIAGMELQKWWDAYDSAAVDSEASPPDELVTLVRTAAAVASSPLPRAFTSARVLDPTREPLVVPEAPEVGSFLPRCRLRLPARLWSALARIRWATGRSDAEESVADARDRAGAVAEKLEFLARERGSVAFVGHGILNHLIATALTDSGWVGVATRPRRHWGWTTFSRPLPRTRP